MTNKLEYHYQVESVSESRSLYRLRDNLKQHPSNAKVELSTATLLMLVEELIEAIYESEYQKRVLGEDDIAF